MYELTWTDIRRHAKHLVESKIAFHDADKKNTEEQTSFLRAYPVSTGGVHAAQAIQAEFYGMHPYLWDDGTFTGGGMELVETPGEAQIFIDAVIDTGETRRRYHSAYPGKPFYALVDKSAGDLHMVAGDEKIQFPWERVKFTCPTCGERKNCDTPKN